MARQALACSLRTPHQHARGTPRLSVPCAHNRAPAARTRRRGSAQRAGASPEPHGSRPGNRQATIGPINVSPEGAPVGRVGESQSYACMEVGYTDRHDAIGPPCVQSAARARRVSAEPRLAGVPHRAKPRSKPRCRRPRCVTAYWRTPCAGRASIRSPESSA